VELPTDRAVVDAEAVRVGAEDGEVDICQEARVVSVRDRGVPRGQDERADPLTYGRGDVPGREGLLGERGARRFVVGAPGDVDRVMEPDGDLELIGALGVVTDPVELLEALGDMRDDVILPPRLRVARDQLAVQGRGIRSGADAAPEGPEPPDLQNVKPSSI
jgi:hypothetical protein